jgi:hypothetical protein
MHLHRLQVAFYQWLKRGPPHSSQITPIRETKLRYPLAPCLCLPVFPPPFLDTFLESLPKNNERRALELPVLPVVPSGRRIGLRYQEAAKSRLTQKYYIRNIAKHLNV